MYYKIKTKIKIPDIIKCILFLYVLSLYLLTYREGLYRFSNLLALLFMISAWFEFLLTKRKLVLNRTILLYFIFIVITIFSIIYAADQNVALIKVRTLILLFILALTLVNYINTLYKLIKLMKYFVYSGFIASIYILITSDFSNITRYGDQLGNENAIGMILGISGTFCVYFILSKKKYFHILFLLTILPVILLTGSRKSFLFIIMNLLIILYLSNNRGIKNKLKFIFIGLILTIIVFYLIFNVTLFYEILGERIENLTSFLFKGGTREGSINTRFRMIKIGLDVFKNKPIFGYGVDNYKVLYSQITGDIRSYSHNNFIELLVDTGIIGFFVYYIMQLLVINDLFKISKRIKDKLLAYTFIAIIFSYIVLSMALIYYYSKHFYFILIMASFVIKLKKQCFLKNDLR